MQEQLDEDYRKLSSYFHQYYTIFYIANKITTIQENNDIPTMQVSASGGNLMLEANPSWWFALSEEERRFVLGHEFLHILLEHCTRGSISPKERDKENIVMDVVVNDMLVQEFGFDSKLPVLKNACTHHSVFKNKEPKGQSFEYYLNRLPQQASYNQMDVHIHITAEQLAEIINNIAQGISTLSPDEQEQILAKLDKVSKEAGVGMRSSVKIFNLSNRKNMRWTSLIKKMIRMGVKSEDSWLTTPRRLSAFESNTFLPLELEQEKKNKPEVHFYLDTSGSCYSHAVRFAQIIAQLPTKDVEFKLFGFTDHVYPIKLGKNFKLEGWGGTRFDIIENNIRETTKKYPLYVFVVTDGWGNKVHPKKPEAWYWFLTERGSKHYISKDSKVYDLKDFEIS